MSGSLTPDVVAVLRRPEHGCLLLITIGNPLRADDGAGPALASLVSGGDGLIVVDAGNSPEEIPFFAEGTDAGRIVIFDAADFAGTAGEVRVIPHDLVPGHSLSSHAIGPAVIVRLLAKKARVPVVFLGIQAGCLDYREGLSTEVDSSVRAIASFLREEYHARASSG